MLKSTYQFEELGMMSQIIKDLVAHDNKTANYISDYFSLDKTLEYAKSRTYQGDRTILKEVFNQQNSIGSNDLVQANISALEKENTYTITTGHQLNLFGGPLYSIYKICQVIAISRALNARQNENHFVPVFWMATEDHDFEEINHFHLFGQQLSWDIDSKDSITGEIKIEAIEELLAQVEDKFNQDEQLKMVKEITNCYRSSETLAEAHHKLVRYFFKDTELLIIDANHPKLKKMFADTAIKEVKEQFVFTAVNETNQKLELDGYHQQVFVRECNLFHIAADNTRERIAYEEGGFHFNDKRWSEEDLVTAIQESPEAFSPNALMRPMYQEIILPNVVYLGGGGEIAYWMQLKKAFEVASIPFPILRVRHSVLLMNQKSIDLLNELEVELMDLKLGVDAIIKSMAVEDAGADLDLEAVYAGVNVAKNELLNKANAINKGFEGMIEAEFAKFQKSLQKIEQRLIKAEKGKFDKTEKQLKRLSDQIFPNGGFQERYDNILSYYLQNPHIVAEIMAKLEAEKNSCIELIHL